MFNVFLMKCMRVLNKNYKERKYLKILQRLSLEVTGIRRCNDRYADE